MRASRPVVVALLAAALALGLLNAGCGSSDDDSTHVKEGEPLTLGPLKYNVLISRILNINDQEDSAYLVGQPPPPPNAFYFGVFMQVENPTDTAQPIAGDYEITDTLHHRYKPVPSHGLFALDLGGTAPANGQLPEPETMAANGPIQGSMVLFLVNDSASENRPLVLQITSPSGESGEIELDL
jgi:hypothetical protein